MLFADATAMARTEDPHVHVGRIREGWDIAGNTNGGYLLALATRAMLDVSGRPDVAAVTAHYLAPGRAGPVTATSELVKAGKQFATVRSTLAGPDDRGGTRPVLSLLGAFTEHTGLPDGAVLVDGAPPDLPDPDECDSTSTPMSASFTERFDLRVHPDDTGFRTGARSTQARVRGWFRLHDDEPLDTIGVVQAVDSFPPSVFNADVPVAWTPTVELTVHVRARPVPGWLRCELVTRFVSEGFLEEDTQVWDAAGRLVAQSRQLALVPRVS